MQSDLQLQSNMFELLRVKGLAQSQNSGNLQMVLVGLQRNKSTSTKLLSFFLFSYYIIIIICITYAVSMFSGLGL